MLGASLSLLSVSSVSSTNAVLVMPSQLLVLKCEPNEMLISLGEMIEINCNAVYGATKGDVFHIAKD